MGAWGLMQAQWTIIVAEAHSIAEGRTDRSSPMMVQCPRRTVTAACLSFDVPNASVVPSARTDLAGGVGGIAVAGVTSALCQRIKTTAGDWYPIPTNSASSVLSWSTTG